MHVQHRTREQKGGEHHGSEEKGREEEGGEEGGEEGWQEAKVITLIRTQQLHAYVEKKTRSEFPSAFSFARTRPRPMQANLSLFNQKVPVVSQWGAGALP